MSLNEGHAKNLIAIRTHTGADMQHSVDQLFEVATIFGRDWYEPTFDDLLCQAG